MTDYASRITAVIGSAPPELVTFYLGDSLPCFDALRIKCISFDEAEHYSKCLAKFASYNELGLWALDDANDSNPYCLITRGPLVGKIIHVYHDDAPDIAFQSLDEFITVPREAGENGIDIDDIQESAIRFPVDRTMDSLINSGEDEEELICLYLTVANDLSLQTKNRLASYDNFFVREGLADHLKEYGTPEDLEIAEKLACDPHPQVVRPGREAVLAIKRRSSATSNP